MTFALTSNTAEHAGRRLDVGSEAKSDGGGREQETVTLLRQVTEQITERVREEGLTEGAALMENGQPVLLFDFQVPHLSLIHI
eukprot:794264-Rhodomonas_salina.1